MFPCYIKDKKKKASNVLSTSWRPTQPVFTEHYEKLASDINRPQHILKMKNIGKKYLTSSGIMGKLINQFSMSEIHSTILSMKKKIK